MDWTIGPLDTFLDRFFLGPFYWERGGGHTINTQGVVGCSPSVLKRGGGQTFVSQGGVEDELLVLKKGWEEIV